MNIYEGEEIRPLFIEIKHNIKMYCDITQYIFMLCFVR